VHAKLGIPKFFAFNFKLIEVALNITA